jgi:hypothetical protein
VSNDFSKKPFQEIKRSKGIHMQVKNAFWFLMFKNTTEVTRVRSGTFPLFRVLPSHFKFRLHPLHLGLAVLQRLRHLPLHLLLDRSWIDS